MKYTVPIIVSLACAAVQALPISDKGNTNDAGVDNLFGEFNNLFGSLGNDVSKLSGSLEDQVGAKFKRSLPGDMPRTRSKRAKLVTRSPSAADLVAKLNLGIDVDANVSVELDDEVKRSPEEENEEAPDCADGEDISDNSAHDDGSTAGTTSDTTTSAENTSSNDSDDGGVSGDDSTAETTSDTANSAENTASDDSDDGSLVDDSSLTANDIENGVSAEGADQTGLSRRTIAAISGNLDAALADLEAGITTVGLID